MIKDIVLYSPIALEKWDWTTIDTTGIGGSETAHVVMAKIFGDLMFDHNIYSVAPCDRIKLGPGGVQWFPLSQKDILLKDNTPKIWLIFRDPFFFDQELSKDSKYYFIAQDVDYPWTEEGLSRVDKYICLCKEHAKYTAGRYPKIKDKIYISTNGIRSDYIRKFIKENDSARKMKRLIYSSSPDRGLELILDNFWRITERHPDVKLDVYYGFNNLEKIAKNNKDTRLQNLHNKLIQKQQELKEWVTFHGRISQPQLYKEMLTSSVWFYPSDWPETSCITSMEMQACGVYPILNKFWAQGENVFNGILIDGVPQKDILCKTMLFKELNNCLEGFEKTHEDFDRSFRNTISEDALDSFDWNKVAKQYMEWFKNE